MKVRSIFCVIAAVLMLTLLMSGCSLIGIADEEEAVSSTETEVAEQEENIEIEEETVESEPEIEAVDYSHDGHSAGQSVEMKARFGADGEMKTVAAEHMEMYDGIVVMDCISEFDHWTEGADTMFYREADVIDDAIKAILVLNYTPNDRAELWVDKAETNLRDFYGLVERNVMIIDGVEAITLEMAEPLDGSDRMGLSGYIDLADGLLYFSVDYSSDTEEAGEMMRAMVESLSFPTV